MKIVDFDNETFLRNFRTLQLFMMFDPNSTDFYTMHGKKGFETRRMVRTRVKLTRNLLSSYIILSISLADVFHLLGLYKNRSTFSKKITVVFFKNSWIFFFSRLFLQFQGDLKHQLDRLQSSQDFKITEDESQTKIKPFQRQKSTLIQKITF